MVHSRNLTSLAVSNGSISPEVAPQRSGIFVVSLDFELYWGMRHRRDVNAYHGNLVGARRAIPEILKLFTKFELHATWAVVGFLFFDRTRALLNAAPTILPAYDNPALAVYQDLPSDDARDEPSSVFFAPSLIKLIADTPHQEVATHSFSHYSCLEAGQTLASFREDLKAAGRAAQRRGLSPTSLVFPKNQVNPDYLPACVDLGITAYRGNPSSWLYRATPDRDQRPLRRLIRLFDSYLPLSGANCSPIPRGVSSSIPVNVPASRYLRPYSPLLKLAEPIRLRRIKRDMWNAAKNNQLFHLWWHPHDFGLNLEQNLKGLEQLLIYFATLRQHYGMETLTMRELAQRATSTEYQASSFAPTKTTCSNAWALAGDR